MADSTTETSTGAHRAGLFDIRFIIAALLGIYGVITVLAGLFGSDSAVKGADDLNINLIAGIGMLVVSAGFAAWARLRPIVVPDEPQSSPDDDGPAGH